MGDKIGRSKQVKNTIVCRVGRAPLQGGRNVCGKCCRGGKRIDVGVLRRKFRQGIKDTGSKQIGDRAATAVTAQPKRNIAQCAGLPCLCKILQECRVCFCCRARKAFVHSTITQMQIACPLCTVTGTPQENRKDGLGLAVFRPCFLRKGVGGAVGGVVAAFVVIKVYSIGKAKLLVSCSKICFAAYIALYSVISVAVPCSTGRKAHGQACKGKLGIVFCSRMRKEPVAIINCGGCIRLR